MDTTGIPAADEMIELARSLSLEAEVRVTDYSATLYNDGTVMIPKSVTVAVTVTVPIPDALKTGMGALYERNERVSFCYSRYEGNRGRFLFGERSNLNGVTKANTPKALRMQLRVMSHSVGYLERRAAKMAAT